MKVESKLQVASTACKLKHINEYLHIGKKTNKENSVLLVDDDPVMLKLMKTILKTCNNIDSVNATKSAEEAIDYLLSRSVDVVVTDVNMNGMSGIELLKWVKKKLPSTFVVIITGNLDMATCWKARSNGADDYITKPFSISELRAAVEKCFANLTDMNGKTVSVHSQ